MTRLNGRRNWEGGRELRKSREKLQKLFSACKINVSLEVTQRTCKTEQ